MSHASNQTSERLAKNDLLPKLKNKILVTKELAPLFRGRDKDLEERFSILIGVLDGEGFVSDSGVHGRRGVETAVVFNWLGATTPIPRQTHRLMSQLGTRLLFYEVPPDPPTRENFRAYVQSGKFNEGDQYFPITSRIVPAG